MYWTLAMRHLLVRPGRALVLLLGYALGVAVMIVLLSVGGAMLDQSRDASLVGGGQLTALPEGVDVEAMRTGGLAGMFFGINGARFVSRELIGGQRQRGMVDAVSPTLEQKLLFVSTHDTTWTVRAGGELPAAARAAGAGLRLLAGAWADSRDDTAWQAPDAQALYDQLDHFHRPPPGDSTWAEWHYFNLVVSDREWWYITLLVGGEAGGRARGGEVLVTHRSPDGSYRRFTSGVGADRVTFDTVHADVVVGTSNVTQRDGRYRLRGRAGDATFDVLLTPRAHHYFPSVELGADAAGSGYVVPSLDGTASGQLCAGTVCRVVRDVPAYHDHNWGSWSGVTWEWGAGQGPAHSILYGGVLAADRAGADIPFVLGIEDSLGLEQVYRFDAIAHAGSRPVPGMPGVSTPDSLWFTAARLRDTLRVVIVVVDAAASRSAAAGPGRVFLQMRGRWRASGTAAGQLVADSGTGFFETWTGTVRHSGNTHEPPFF